MLFALLASLLWFPENSLPITAWATVILAFATFSLVAVTFLLDRRRTEQVNTTRKEDRERDDKLRFEEKARDEKLRAEDRERDDRLRAEQIKRDDDLRSKDRVEALAREERYHNDQRTRDALERKERLLNEVIQWLKNIEGDLYANTEMNLNGLLSLARLGMSVDTLKSVKAAEYSGISLVNIMKVTQEGKYVHGVSTKLDETLGIMVERILSAIEEREKMTPLPSKTADLKSIKAEDPMIDDYLTNDKSLEGLKVSEYGLMIIKLGRNAKSIKNLVLETLNRAIEIKWDLVKMERS